MIIHLYTFCWNEAFMIPFFLRHYQKVVDKIVVYDNESNDNSVELLSKHEKVLMRSYSTNGEFIDGTQRMMRNQEWKKSRGKADWVMLPDMDEFLYYPQGLQVLLDMAEAQGITALVPEGFEMISETLPDSRLPMLEQVRFGVKSTLYDKPVVFKPDSIQEMNFHAGAHGADPIGNVKRAYIPGFQLRHFKYLSYERYSSRAKVLLARANQSEKDQGCHCHHYSDDQKLSSHFNLMLSQAQELL